MYFCLQFIKSDPSGTFAQSGDKYFYHVLETVARRGRPRVVYSDNGGAFIKASKWLEQLPKDEKQRGLVEQYEINWKFNLSCEPWWGGQFERLRCSREGENGTAES